MTGVSLDFGRTKTFESLLWPGGPLCLVAILIFGGGVLALPPVAVAFFYFGITAMGILIAWRFHSARALFALVTILLAQRALGFFASGHVYHAGPGRIAFEAISFLLPINLACVAWVRERGLTPPVIAGRSFAIFLQAVLVAVLCRPGATASPYPLHHAWVAASWTRWAGVPQSGLLAFSGAAVVVLARFVKEGKPIIAGFFWMLVSTFLALRIGGLGPAAFGYLGTASLFVLISLVETSYAMAYYDELTGLPGRRAFNEALLMLDGNFAIAIVDIDHFKSVNDTYGHDVGDQVLRMVAAKLGRVTGGGKAFRCGGEEFAIIFAGQASRDVIPHLEGLRAAVEIAAFRARGQERRAQPRPHTDRRRAASSEKRRKTAQLMMTPDSSGLHVTISIGVAEASVRTRRSEQVIHEADEALYRAKRGGRNRLEMGTRSSRSSRKPKFKAAGV